LDPVFPLIFSKEHEAVGAPDDLVYGLRRKEIDGRSHAQSDPKPAFLQSLYQPGSKTFKRLGNKLLPGLRHEDGKLIPPHAGHNIGGPGIVPKGGGHQPKELISALMPELIIHGLEIIAIRVDKGQGMLVAAAARDFPGGQLAKISGIGDSGQRILPG
jgi:hypothetical protein